MARHPDVQKILEQTLLGEALMSAPIAASVFDDERNYVAVNDAFCTLTQYQRAELTALKAGTKLAPDREAREAIAKALRGHGAVGQVNLKRKDGTIVRTSYWVMKTTASLLPYFLRLSWQVDEFRWLIVPAEQAATTP
jgi:PAS domain S-box-containing protein